MPDSTPQTFPPADSLPDEIRRNFVPVAAATDTPAPGDGSRLPLVNLAQPISSIARTVGMILHPAPIFRFGNGISTVDEVGEVSPMSGERFTSWVEDYLTFTRPGKEAPRVESIGKDMAGKIMASDKFRNQLHELKGVSQVRLPVWRGEGEKRDVELAPVGFDEETGIFTLNRIPYDEGMEGKEAWEILWEKGLKDFPFDLEDAERKEKCRSFAAQIAAMLGVYCHALFPEGTPMPMIVLNANQPGSGKSLLMRMILAPVFGAPPESGKPETENEFEKVLDSAAIARKPFLVLDDCKSIHSQALNRFVTSPVHECRLMHSQRLAMVPKVTQVLCTGNALSISEDLDRRSLVIDLFEPGEAAARTFKNPITPSWLFSDSTRSRFLAALWYLVRAWKAKGRPLERENGKPSFEEWTGLVGGIVTSFGMANPFAARETTSGGDEASRALKMVIAGLVGECEEDTPPVFVTDEILGRAEEMDMLELVVGFAKEPKRALGHRLKKLKGRHLVDSRGRLFEFGKREASAGAKYPVRFL